MSEHSNHQRSDTNSDSIIHVEAVSTPPSPLDTQPPDNAEPSMNMSEFQESPISVGSEKEVSVGSEKEEPESESIRMFKEDQLSRMFEEDQLPEVEDRGIPRSLLKASKDRLILFSRLQFENILIKFTTDLSTALTLNLMDFQRDVIRNLIKICPEFQKYKKELYGQEKEQEHDNRLFLKSVYDMLSPAEKKMFDRWIPYEVFSGSSHSPRFDEFVHTPLLQLYYGADHIQLFNLVVSDFENEVMNEEFLLQIEHLIGRMYLDMKVDEKKIQELTNYLFQEFSEYNRSKGHFGKIKKSMIESAATTIRMAKKLWKADLETDFEKFTGFQKWPYVDFIILPSQALGIHVYLGGVWVADDLKVTCDTRSILISFEKSNTLKKRKVSNLYIPLPCQIVKGTLEANFDNYILFMKALRV